MTSAPGATSDFLSKLFRLDDRVAVVTGGASGLGAAMANGLAAAGAIVVIADKNEEGAVAQAAAIAEAGGSATAHLLDVTDATAVAGFADRVVEELGRVDVLLNSAGAAYRCSIEDFPEEALDFILDLNLKGTYLMAQAIGRKMLEAESGSIINIASIGGFIAYPHASAYLASKGGVVQATRAFALEWIGRGVRVNAIAPGLCETPLIKGLERISTVTTDFIQERMLRPALIQPEELVGAAIFLASDASARVTGHVLAVDDGYLIA